MTAKWLTRLLRRNVASVYLYGILRSAMLAAQWVMRRPDEPDLLLLARIPGREHEVILDIGANGGQSAVALGYIRPRAQIISFEPLAPLWPELARVRMLLGGRFAFRKYALGETAGSFPLFVPVSGELPITTRASISQEAAQVNCRELEQAIGLQTRIDTVQIEVRRGDCEKLAPLAIKIDVEGAEHQVIVGLQQTIVSHRPVVILERSESFADCAGFFRKLGYDILTSGTPMDGSIHLPGLSTRNWIACPPELTPHLRAA